MTSIPDATTVLLTEEERAELDALAAGGTWQNDRTHGLQFRAQFLKTSALFKQGEPAICPRFEARSARESIAYAKMLLQRNPATLSGVITLPALAVFCAGLFQALPAYLAALITAGHLIAATFGRAGIAPAKTSPPKALQTGP